MIISVQKATKTLENDKKIKEANYAYDKSPLKIFLRWRQNVWRYYHWLLFENLEIHNQLIMNTDLCEKMIICVY